MRIVFFTRRHGPAVGGVETYIQCLARAVAGLGHHPVVVTGAHRPGLDEHEVVDGIEVYRYPAYRSPLRAWSRLMRMGSLFARADVVHVSDTAVLEYYYRMLAWRFVRTPVFLTRHGMSMAYPVPQSEKARARRSLDWVHGVAHDGLFIEKWLGVTPDCTPDQGLFPEADDIAPTPEPSVDRAVFIGRLEQDSGIGTYLEALDILQRRHGVTLHLDVYGDGTELPRLRRYAAEHRLAVSFKAACPDARARLVDGAFALVTGRMAIQEAMARRRLVIAVYDNPLKRDYLTAERFSPYLLAGGSAEAISDHLIYYRRRPGARRAMIERAYAYARTLSWPTTAEAYCRLWRAAPRRVMPPSWSQRMKTARALVRERRGNMPLAIRR